MLNVIERNEKRSTTNFMENLNKLRTQKSEPEHKVNKPLLLLILIIIANILAEGFNLRLH